MTDTFPLLVGGLGILTYYNLQPKAQVVTEKVVPTGNRRRLLDEPFNQYQYRAAAQHLPLSGHEDELRFRLTRPMSMQQVREMMAQKQDMRVWLLNSYHFNVNGITKRQQFAGPAKEIRWPQLEALTGWYRKAASSKKPYLTRILPYPNVY